MLNRIKKTDIFYVLLIAIFASNYSLYIPPLKLVNLELCSTLMKYIFISSTSLLFLLNFQNLKQSRKKISKFWSFNSLFVIKIIILLMFIVVIKAFLYESWLVINKHESTTFLSLENNVKIFLNLFLMTQVILYAKSFKKLKIIFYILSTSLIIPSLILLIYDSSLLGQRIVTYKNIIFDGSIWNGAIISFLTCFWLGLYFYNHIESRHQRIFLAIYLFIIFLIGITSSSRIIFLSIIISFVPLIQFVNMKTIKDNKWLAFLVVCLLFVIYLFFSEEVGKSLYRFGQIFESVHFNREPRIMIWTSYIKDFRKYFLFGYFNANPLEIHMGFQPHNILLNYFSRFGIFAFLLYIYLIIEISKNVLKTKTSVLLISSLIMYIVSVTINQTGYIDSAFYIQLSLIYSLSSTKIHTI